MLRYFITICLALSAISCQNKKDQAPCCTRFHDNGKAKPIVAIAPVIDSTSSEIPWSLSDELSALIRSTVTTQGDLYVSPKEECDKLTTTQNPFSNDLSWVKEAYANQEFVVFMELVRHENVPVKGYKSPQMPPLDVSSNLEMALRIRVVDNRSKSPKIVLQEIVKDSYFTPKTILKTNYNRVAWGSNEYRSTPLALAHSELAKSITERIHDYVLLSDVGQ